MIDKHNIPVELLPPDYRSAVTTGVLEVWYGDGSYIVPKGFTTDFASIPRFFWRIWPPWGPWTPAAIMHDRLYEVQRCTREEADRRFRGAMKELGVGWFTRWAFWLGVRVGGWRHWKRK